MKIKKDRYYVDTLGRIYGPMQFHKPEFSSAKDYFTAPGHQHRWLKDGKSIIQGIFQHNANLLDLVEEIELKKKKK